MGKLDINVKKISDYTLAQYIEQYEKEATEQTKVLRNIHDTLFELKRERELRRSIEEINQRKPNA